MGPMTLLLSPQLSFSPMEREGLLLVAALLQKPPFLLWQDCSFLSTSVVNKMLVEFSKRHMTVVRVIEPMPAHWYPWLG